VALVLLEAGRLDDARLYAEAALKDSERLGPAAASEVQLAKAMLRDIEQARRGA
jgi:hypothetical protein